MLFYFLLFLFFLLYYNNSFICLLLGLEFVLIFIYYYCGVMAAHHLVSFSLVMVVSFFLVMEAILGLSILLVNYRHYGFSFFNVW